MVDTHAPEGREDLCVVQVPLFHGLDYDDQVNVAEVATPTSVAAGEQVYAAGSDTSQLMVVHTGALKVSRIDAEGREQILRVLGPGEFVGESAFLTGARPDHFTTALEPSSMCVFRHADLGRLVAAHPSIGMRMLQEVSRRLAQTETRLASVISGDVTSRLAEYVLSLHGTTTEDGVVVELPLAKKDIASLLDTTPESLSRQLRKLQQSGIAHTQGARGLIIHDIDALMDLAAVA
ncbi:Crp/Fnr family transcriptional regulator [Pseudactinotalea sp. Z1739]|uniref:Crp/Fnr family transcriptional regulator n=1 Tax=Pseudactinotalea sp. Z1739 TaxID=3413028 RepID=UPI003C79B4D8